jgi:hypothetical protein
VLDKEMRSLWVCTLALQEQACNADMAVAELLSTAVSDPLSGLPEALENEASLADALAAALAQGKNS